MLMFIILYSYKYLIIHVNHSDTGKISIIIRIRFGLLKQVRETQIESFPDQIIIKAYFLI